MDTSRNNIKKEINLYRPCISCSEIIELRDYYRNHYSLDTVEKSIKKWTDRSSWVFCPNCERKKKRYY